ncbi:hypothetical protein SAMN05216228_104713 [Rhizobium tibeticum]|uniref:Uncharacterized protein n=1 Tax=Rhizobium tibeticum TaxID=501024 RepID=A0A1H8VU75_9HYPH|nr:hypothetical protein RTCCBAU85039_6205 [Rhizobium tibeticum]SEP18767.1 hypothetical protein SAMN05216228_104713 [Rhizobium tibeticum]
MDFRWDQSCRKDLGYMCVSIRIPELSSLAIVGLGKDVAGGNSRRSTSVRLWVAHYTLMDIFIEDLREQAKSVIRPYNSMAMCANAADADVGKQSPA